MSWLTLEAVKAAKNITDTSQDAAITALLGTAEDFVAAQLPRFVPRQVVTEQQHGEGHDEMVLRKRPVCGIASLKDSLARDWASTDEITNYDVDPDSGVLRLDQGIGGGWFATGGPFTGRCFQDGNRNVRVIYVAGYGERVDTVSSPADENDLETFEEFALPGDVVKYASDYILACLNTSGSEGLGGESAGGYSYTTATAILAEVFHTTVPGAKAIYERWQDPTGAR